MIYKRGKVPPGREKAVDKLTQERLQREAERLIKAGKMPSLKEVCAAVLESRRRYANQIRRARREAREKVVVN